MPLRILIVEDDSANYYIASERLGRDLRTRGDRFAIPAFWSDGPAEQVADLIDRVKTFDAVVFDLHLDGTSIDGGLSVIRSVRHFFTGVFVIHSNTYVNDADVRAKAKALGVCLGTGKLADDLEDKVYIASRLHQVKAGLMLPFQKWMRKPVADCCPDDLDWHYILWQCHQMGVNFDGTAESIDWERAQLLEYQCKRLAEAAACWYRQQSRDKRENGPEFINDYPPTYDAYLTEMVERIREGVELAKPYITA